MESNSEKNLISERLGLMLDTIPLGVHLWDSDLKKVECNQALVKLFKLGSKADYLKSSIADFSPEFQPDGQRSAEKATAFLNKAITEGRCDFGWIQKLPKTGEQFPTSISLIRVDHENDITIVGITQDMREQNKMMAELDQHSNELKAVVSSHPGLIFSINSSEIITTIDGKLLYDLGFAPIQFTNRDLDFALNYKFFTDIIKYTRLTFTDGEQDTYVKVDGGTYQVRTTPLYNDYGMVTNIVTSVDDITEITRAKEAAEQSTRIKSDFLAKMSHEIRTPMNAIIGLTDLSLREDDLSKIREYALTVKQAGTNLLAIINDILDFSKIESGNLEILTTDYSVASLINDVVSIIRMRVLDSPLRFIVNIDGSIPETLNGDEIRIRQAMINVLSNAVKYTDKGFVFLNVFPEFIDENTLKLFIEVSDSGRGIKPEDLDKLFIEFSQVDIEANHDVEGIGLGLAITYNLINAMDGKIVAESEYGKGSKFTLIIPQKYHINKPLAKVNKPEDMSIIIFEKNERYSNPIIYALENLGVNYVLVTDSIEFTNKMNEQAFKFMFVSYYFYRQFKDSILQFRNEINIVVLTEFGESVTEAVTGGKMYVLSMPIYSVPVANILNGVYDKHVFENKNELIVNFSAPDVKVLVVDDIKTNLKVAQGFLVQYGMQVELCNNGKSAIDTLKSKEFDLVFMDHKMPEMDGVEATIRIREMGKSDPYFSELPIIALTANTIVGAKELLIEKGFSDFISKPIDMIKLNEILEKWVPKSKQVAL